MRAKTAPRRRVRHRRAERGPLGAELLLGQDQPQAAGQVGHGLDEFVGRHRQGRGPEDQGQEAVAEAHGRGQGLDLALEVLAPLHLQGHEKGIGQGLQGHAGGQQQHDPAQRRGVALPLDEDQGPQGGHGQQHYL